MTEAVAFCYGFLFAVFRAAEGVRVTKDIVIHQAMDLTTRNVCVCVYTHLRYIYIYTHTYALTTRNVCVCVYTHMRYIYIHTHTH